MVLFLFFFILPYLGNFATTMAKILHTTCQIDCILLKIVNRQVSAHISNFDSDSPALVEIILKTTKLCNSHMKKNNFDLKYSNVNNIKV